MTENTIEHVSYNFAEGQARARTMSDAELLGALRDLREVIDIQEADSRQGLVRPKLGYYWDEYHTYVAENKRRGQERKRAKEEQFYLLSPSHLRQYTLDSIRRQRPHWDADRVSRAAMLRLEEYIKSWVDNAVLHQPSSTKTFMDYT